MPLSEFFADQFRQIRTFLLDPVETVRVVRVDPDLEPILLRALVRMDGEPDNVHAMLFAEAPFLDAAQWFSALLDGVRAEYETNVAQLAAAGCTFVAPLLDASLDAGQRFCVYASALAEALPDTLGALVIVVQPAEVVDPAAFRDAIAWLAREVRSSWLKFLVLDARQQPRLEQMETKLSCVGAQTFHLAPEEIERRLKESVADPDPADPRTHRRMLGILAGFAFGRKEYHEAARLQYAWAKQAEAASEPADAAVAYYNLGNTMLAAEALEHAERFLVRSCELCLEHGANGVLPMALTNLGITLSRLHRQDEAIETLLIAYRTYKAQRHRPGQAFVFDTLAGVYQEAGRLDDAERAWLAAYDLYDGITASAFADLRRAGREDIRGRLERFWNATGRPDLLSSRARLAGVS